MSKRIRYTIETLLVNALILSSFYQLLVYLANRRLRNPAAARRYFAPVSVVIRCAANARYAAAAPGRHHPPSIAK
jgi:hypothetical protein